MICITIILRCPTTDPMSTSQPVPLTMTERAPVILVIEDSPTVRHFMVMLLAKRGFETLSASNGEEGLTLARERHPDVAVCDIHMPVLDGWGFVQAARALPELHDMMVLMVTSAVDTQMARRAMLSGADDFLRKPWQPDELDAAVRALLDKRARQRAQAELSMQQLRTAVLANVPHELRTPLTSILGVTELMIDRRGKYDEDRALSMLQQLRRNAERLGHIITRMMSWAELNATPPDPRRVLPVLDVPAAVQTWVATPEFRAEVLASQPGADQPEAPGMFSGRRLRLRLEAGQAACDEQDLRDMLVELVSNAVRFSRPGMPVGLTGRPLPEGGYQLEVANVGISMPEAFIRSVGALAQADRDQHEQQGLGLGLALTGLRARRNRARLKVLRHDGQPTQLGLELAGTH